jgi:hypothetical protein
MDSVSHLNVESVYAVALAKTSHPWAGLKAQGCWAGAGGLAMFFVRDDGVVVSVPHAMGEGSPLLCCDYAIISSRHRAVAVAGGLSTSSICVAWVIPPQEAVNVKRRKVEAEATEAQGEPWNWESSALKRLVGFQELAVGGGKGAINAVAMRCNSDSPDLVSVWLGYQNGDVVRCSLLFRTDGVALVGGADSVIHSHSMDVRSLCIVDDARVVSVADDGCVLVSPASAVSGAATSSSQPILVSPMSELLCCTAFEGGTIKCASRDRQVFVVDLDKAKVVSQLGVADVIRSLSHSAWVTQSGACFVDGVEVVPASPTTRGCGGSCNECDRVFAFVRGTELFIKTRD